LSARTQLTARLGARRLAAWAFALVLTAALFGTMSGRLSDLIANTPASAALFDKMAPEMRPVVQYTTLFTVVMVALVATAVVQRVLGLAASEEKGLSEAVLACGVPRTRALSGRGRRHRRRGSLAPRVWGSAGSRDGHPGE